MRPGETIASRRRVGPLRAVDTDGGNVNGEDFAGAGEELLQGRQGLGVAGAVVERVDGMSPGDLRELALAVREDARVTVVVLGGEDPPPGARELARTLRHADVSTVIDLSKLTHAEKVAYVSTLMPMLAALRRQTGVPHKILLDEAHYFLQDVQHTRIIDPELAGYIVVTYRLSSLDPAIRMTGDVVAFVTRERDVAEIDAVLAMCHPTPDRDTALRMLGALATHEAALLPGAEESHGALRRFSIAPRLTAHVRHRAKYVDMPIAEAQAFVFDAVDVRPPYRHARSLKEFLVCLQRLPAAALAGHIGRHDFSRWLNDVFRDRPLAAHIAILESRLLTDDVRVIVDTIVQAIRARYEMSPALPLAAA